MALMYRALLRLHVEAVWGVKLPFIEKSDIELLPESPLPSWKLCVASLAEGRVRIWRPDVGTEERKMLQSLEDKALAFSLQAPLLPGVSRELAFSQLAVPRLALDAAQTIARPLTLEDRRLVELFSGDISETDGYLHATKQPLIGVIVANRLICIAHSSRRTQEACELGIDTLPDARRKGYALAATIVWAHSVRQAGLVHIYSSLAENTASLGLAHAAGYRPFARVATFISE